MAQALIQQKIWFHFVFGYNSFVGSSVKYLVCGLSLYIGSTIIIFVR